MSSAYSSSIPSATHRRRVRSENDPCTSGTGLHRAVDPAPIPRPAAQFLAFGLIIFLGFLQFLPATHFRDPSDPFRKWLPFDSNSSLPNTSHQYVTFTTPNRREDGMVHIVSWMDCLDLRVLSVLMNSTLSSTRFPDLVYFHFFVPEGLQDKVNYFKLKVLFPHTNIEILGQREVKEKTLTAISGGEFAGPSFEEFAPFVIPSVYVSLTNFIYVSPNVIVKGRIEELYGVKLGNYAIAAAEDCSKRLNAYINSDVLDAIQRSASKPWVSGTLYRMNSCMLDSTILLIDGRKLGHVAEAIFWWGRVLNRSGRTDRRDPAIALALYDRYIKLSTSWLVTDLASSENDPKRMIIGYCGPQSSCSEFGSSDLQNIWNEYLPLMADRILST